MSEARDPDEPTPEELAATRRRDFWAIVTGMLGFIVLPIAFFVMEVTGLLE